MPVNIYKGGSNLEKNELRILESIYNQIKEWNNKYKEICYLYLGFDCHNPLDNTKCQIDALLIKQNAIINIEIKNINVTHLIIDKQGRLYDKYRKDYVLGERKISSISQVEKQNHSIQNFIFHHQEDLGYKFIKSANDIHVGGFLVLNQLSDLEIDTNRYFLRVTDKSSFVSEMEKYYGKDFNDKSKVMDLSPEFGKKLADLLDLEQIDETCLFYSTVLKDSENKISEYMQSLSKLCFDINYVNRIDEENKLLSGFNTIITGAPGSGKSSLVRYIVYDQTRNSQKTPDYIPCLVNLNAASNVENRLFVSLSLLNKSDITEMLENGRLWIFFDGVDEMLNLRGNIHSLIDFIELYPNNKFTLTIRREVIDNPFFRSSFSTLRGSQKHYQPFQELRIGELSSSESQKLIARITGNEQKYIDRFESLKKQLPDSNPLTIKMAFEIVRSGITLEYENIGKFCEAYFYAILKREIERDKHIGITGDIIIFELLQELGYTALKKGSSMFDRIELISRIRKIAGGDPENYFRLIINAEILVSENSGAESEIQELVSIRYKFSHQSFLDYFVAKSLIDKISSFDDLVKELPGDNRNVSINSMLMFCGINENAELLEELFNKWIEGGELQLAIDCWQNSSIKSVRVVKTFEEALRHAWYNKKYGPNILFKNILRYGHDFGLYRFINEETKKDLFLSIDWEVIKHYRLKFTDTDEKLLKTYRGARQLNEGILGKGYYPGVKNSYIHFHSLTYYDYLGLSLEMQNEKGYRLYYDLLNADDLTPFCLAITDTSFSGDVRANIIRQAYEFVDDHYKEGVTLQTLYLALYHNNLMYDDNSEYYNWMIVTIFHESGEIDYDHDTELLLNKLFWAKYSANVQLKMVRAFEKRFDNKLLIDVLEKYKNNNIIDYDRICHLAGYYYLCAFTEVFGGMDYFVANLEMSEYIGETYEVTIKSAALARLAQIGDTIALDFAEEFVKLENEKISTVSQWILQNYIIKDGKLIELTDKH